MIKERQRCTDSRRCRARLTWHVGEMRRARMRGQRARGLRRGPLFLRWLGRGNLAEMAKSPQRLVLLAAALGSVKDPFGCFFRARRPKSAWGHLIPRIVSSVTALHLLHAASYLDRAANETSFYQGHPWSHQSRCYIPVMVSVRPRV